MKIPQSKKDKLSLYLSATANKLPKSIYKRKPNTTRRFVKDFVPAIPDFGANQRIQTLAFLSANAIVKQIPYVMDWIFTIEASMFSHNTILTTVKFNFKQCGILKKSEEYVLGSDGNEKLIEPSLKKYGYTKQEYGPPWRFFKMTKYTESMGGNKFKTCKRIAMEDGEHLIQSICKHLGYMHPRLILVKSERRVSYMDINEYRVCVSNIQLNAKTTIVKCIDKIAIPRVQNNMDITRPAKRTRRRSC